MAVYTRIDADEVKAFLRICDVGEYIGHDGITQGVENTNYLLATTKGRFILTLVEKRTAPADLPFIFSYMTHLAAAGMPVPNVLAQGVILEKPAAIIEFLEGKAIIGMETLPQHCAQIGAALAQMHRASENFTMTRENPVGIEQWDTLFNAVKPEINSDTAAAIDRALAESRRANWSKLPAGAIHADLFRDNAFFKNGSLSGIIDFYFACTAPYVYDLAITVNAWCFDRENKPRAELVAALVNAYQQIRPLSDDEKNAFPHLRRTAALRILMTRLYDWFFTAPGAQVTRHNPMEYLAKLECRYQWL